MAIYRKLAAPSRGELMAHFLAPHRRESALARHPDLLSDRELRVLDGLLRGLSEKEIADGTEFSSRSVHHMGGAIDRKAGVSSRGTLIASALGSDLEIARLRRASND